MTLVLNPRVYGKGWAPVAQGDHVHTLDQFFDYSRSKWTISGFMTGDKFIHQGRMNYRRPISLLARISALIPLLPKLYRRWRDRKAIKI